MKTRTATFERSERKASTDGLKRYPLTISTETPVKRRDYALGEFDEVLSHDPSAVDLSRAPLPLIESHDRSKVNLGKVEKLRLDGNRLRGEMVLGNSTRAQELAADIEAGIVSGISVGYQITANDFDKKARRMTATRWQPHEVSIVSVPADINAGIGRSKAVSDQDVSIAAEQTRVSTIRSLARQHPSLGSEWADDAVIRGLSVDQARAAALDALATSSESVRIDPPSVRFEITRDASEKFTDHAQAWMLTKFGATRMIEQAQRQGVRSLQKVELEPGDFRGFSMVDIARECLERKGVRTRGMGREKLIGTALTYTRGGENTTSDFAVLLENTLFKVLLGNYALQADTWSLFCKTDVVQDFRTANRYRTGSFGTLSAVPEGSEYQNVAVPDGAKSTLSVQTHGNILAVSRQALVNDDMGAIADTAAKFGRAAKLSIESDVYALLNANSGLGATFGGVPFFDSSYNNVNGTGSTLGVQGLDADRVVLASQKDISANEFLDLAKFGSLTLLVPTSLGGLARNLNKSEWDITQVNKFQTPNIVRGMFANVVDSPRLSGTRRYIFADPGMAPAIVVAFLAESGQEPFLEQRLGWRVDGTEWKVRLDYGTQFFDPKGAVTNAGA